MGLALKPKGGNRSYLTGIEIETINPNLKLIHLMSPPINSRGDKLRDAMKALEDAERIDVKDKERVDKIRKASIQVIVCSVSLQYDVFQEKTDESAAHVLEAPNDDDYIDAIGNYLTDSDIGPAVVSLRIGEKITKKRYVEILNNDDDFFGEKKS